MIKCYFYTQEFGVRC